MKLRGAWGWVAALVAVPWACGGGASIADVCEKVAACDDSQTVEECIEETEELEQNASEAGCGDEVDDLIDCADDTFDCVDGEVQLDCNGELTALLLCGNGGVGPSCSWGCDGNGNCTCSAGPNVDQACCEDDTSCEAALVCEDDCCE